MRITFFSLLLICCSNAGNQGIALTITESSAVVAGDSAGIDIAGRFATPDSFTRTYSDSNSFGYYLRQLRLKAEGAEVSLYNGEIKSGENIYCAVIDMEISPKDLQQCADAVMRLRGEFLFKMKRYSEISFRFLGDGLMHSYLSYAGSDRTYKTFRKYMDHVFNYANTASLKKQLKPKVYAEMEIGDVLIQSGNPFGHAVIVVDMCKNNKGEKMYMLAQSYMPAQETQILINPADSTPWYPLTDEYEIHTPEWRFRKTDLMTW